MVFSFQAAIDQLLEEHTLDLIVDGLANGDFCANIGSFWNDKNWRDKKTDFLLLVLFHFNCTQMTRCAQRMWTT